MTELTQTSPTSEDKEWSLPRGAIVLISIAGLVVAVAGLRAFASVLAPVLLALMIVVAVTPFGSWLGRKGAPGWVRTIAVMFAAFGILLGFVLILVYAGIRLADLIPQYSDDFDSLQRSVQDWLASIGVDQKQIDAATSSFSLSDLSTYLVDLAGKIMSTITSLSFIAIVLFFMAMDFVAFDERLGVSKRIRPDIGAAFESFVSGTRTYLIVSTIFGAIVAVIDTAALAIMGIPLPVVWGLVAFVTNYIPNIGFILGVVPPAIIALLQGGWGLMIAVVIVYSVINFVIQSLIQPKFVGESVNLAVTISFLSLTVWTWILGPLGALLAIPLTLLSKALLIDMDPSTRWVGLLMKSGRPTEEDIALAAAGMVVPAETPREDEDEIREGPSPDQ